MRIGGRREGRGGRQRSGKSSAARLFLFAVVLVAALIIWTDMSIRPAIESIASYQAQVLAARIVNEAILSEMERDGISYDRLVKVTRGENGEIASIEADMAQINRLKSRMSNSVIENLEKSENREISIPAGTLIGNHFTSGRGPLVVIRAIPTGYVQSDIYNHFVSAGINQTLHQIMLNINVQMLAVLPGYTVKTETATSFCIAETVIVGKIPQGYASIGEDTYFSALKGK